MNLKHELTHIAQGALNSPKGENAVPIATSLLAVLQIWIPSILSLVAVCLGISVTLLVRKKNKKQIELLDIELEKARKRRKEDDNDLA